MRAGEILVVDVETEDLLNSLLEIDLSLEIALEVLDLGHKVLVVEVAELLAEVLLRGLETLRLELRLLDGKLQEINYLLDPEGRLRVVDLLLVVLDQEIEDNFRALDTQLGVQVLPVQPHEFDEQLDIDNAELGNLLLDQALDELAHLLNDFPSFLGSLRMRELNQKNSF